MIHVHLCLEESELSSDSLPKNGPPHQSKVMDTQKIASQIVANTGRGSAILGRGVKPIYLKAQKSAAVAEFR